MNSVDQGDASADASSDCGQTITLDEQPSDCGSSDDAAPAPAPGADDSDSDDAALDQAQNIADTVPEEESETIQQSNEPCKVETNTEVVHQPGETFVHHPGPIYINQPPTRLIINHAPYIVRPSPIVVNQAGKKITKAFTTKYLPSPVHVRPVIVRLVKPITKKVLIEKPAKPCQPDQSVIVPPEIPSPCDNVPPSTPAPCTPPPPPPATPCNAADEGIELDSAAAVELQSDDGASYSYETAPASSGCGCQ